MDPNDDELSGLTPEEREQLAELEDADAASTDALRSIAGDDDPNADGEDGDDDPNAGGDDTLSGSDTVPAGDDANDPNAADPNEATPADKAAKAERPIYTAEAPGDVQAQLDALKADRRAVRKQFEQGEIDEDVYDAKIDEIDDKRDALNRQSIKAEVSAEMTHQQMADSYKQTVGDFFADMKAAGVDYRAEANKAAFKHLDATIKALASAPHDQTPEGWRELLENAHTIAAKKFGLKAAPAPAPAPNAQTAPGADKAGKPKAKSRQPDLSGIPPTLRGPSAGDVNVGDAEFGHLDGMSGLELEKAVARMTPEQQEKWLST